MLSLNLRQRALSVLYNYNHQSYQTFRSIGLLSCTCFAIGSFTIYNVHAENKENKTFRLDFPKENEILNQCIKIAMEKPDDKDPTTNWIKYDAGNKAIDVQYKFLPNDSITTIRGYQSMEDIKTNSEDIINDYYNFCNGSYNDIFDWEKICDELCIDKYSMEQIDDTHNIIYSSHNSGVFGVSSRDFCYVKSRHLIDDFKDDDGNEYDLVISLCYSIEDYKEESANHVRGRLKNCGYIFMKNKETGEITACYVLHLDPGGWLPTWVINIVAPKKGMMVNKMHDNYDKIRDFLAKRI